MARHHPGDDRGRPCVVIGELAGSYPPQQPRGSRRPYDPPRSKLYRWRPFRGPSAGPDIESDA